MDRLFAPQGLSDLGPCALTVTPGLVPLRQVHGARNAELRAGVRRECPRRPGVYGMIDRHGELIYVGKAKGLRARLLSYFRPRSRDRKASRIIEQTRTVVWEYSPCEFGALHRELELIGRWRPRMNVQGQPRVHRYTFLCLGRKPAPHAFLARQPPRELLAAFGPIRAGTQAREAARRLNDLFGLRDCPQAQEMVFADQAELFPVLRGAGCLRHEIGTCLGPCAAAVTRAHYAARVRAARAFLEGTDREPLEVLERDLQAAAAGQAYERAAALRDRLGPLRWLVEQLDQVRRLRAEGSFVYPTLCYDGTRIWYLIHHGCAVAALAEPHDDESRQAAAACIEAVYARHEVRLRLDSAEHLDGLLLVASWFRRHPEERLHTWKPLAGGRLPG